MGDSMVPTYIVVNPDGTIGADFTGHVHAAGLDLDEYVSGSSDPQDIHTVAWYDAAGIARAQLLGIHSPTYHNLRLLLSPNFGRDLGRSDGSSDFIQVAGGNIPQNWGLDAGSATAATNGVNSATKVVNHGIGRMPAAIAVLPQSNANAIAQVTAADAAQITVQIAHRDSGSTFGATTPFYWLAIG